TTITADLHQAVIRNFEDAVQIPGQPEKPGGLVRMTLLENDSYKTVIEEQLISLINNLLKKGYAANDIAVLTRKNDEAKEITNYLLNRDNTSEKNKITFGVISDESLYLSNSTAVRFLTGLLRYYIAPEDIINKYLIVSEYINYFISDEERRKFHWFPDNIGMQDHNLLTVFPEGFKRITEKVVDLSLFELVENLIFLFNLNNIKGESVYLQGFQDMILDFTQRKSSSVVDFIEFWDERGCKKPVSLPDNQNAIRVLTIHKAKGLEFPVVIMPYCNWNMADQANRSVLWCKPDQPPFNKLSIVPVEFTSKLGKTQFASAYFEELLKQYIDTINLLYVAFTRASKALFIFSPKSEKGQITNVSDLLLRLVTKEIVPSNDQNVISLKKYYNSTNQVFEYGSLPYQRHDMHSNDTLPAIDNHYPVFYTNNRLRIAYQGKILIEPETNKITRSVSTGSQMHEIFSHIINVNDIPVVINRWRLEGKITASEAKNITSALKDCFKDPQVLSWFSGSWKIMTETEFILPDGTVKRPDRVLTKNDKAIVIDYKFGKIMDNEHQKQVRVYHKLLLDMGYKNVKAWLWYVTMHKVIQVEMG
ncbi:MAG: Dna2/Cas4 domain-containing protein, partial [Bacteroidales bacterium]|nr:Dna2/Cas4 domain-containing protein [Bacteroidales bacterium]